MSQPGVVSFRGRAYSTVAKRVADLKTRFPGYAVVSRLVEETEKTITYTAEIRDESGRVLATGDAREVKGSRGVNETSALENCQTSAVGRALAFFGLGGDEIASADELARALERHDSKQTATPAAKPEPEPIAAPEPAQDARQVFMGRIMASKTPDELRAICREIKAAARKDKTLAAFAEDAIKVASDAAAEMTARGVA